MDVLARFIRSSPSDNEDLRLVRFVEHAATQEGRDEAVRGLVHLGPAPAAREALLRASAAGRVSPAVAARVLVDWVLLAECV